MVAKVTVINGAQVTVNPDGSQRVATIGIQGPTGATGATGAAGADGAPGVNGAPGANGADGADGAPGANGADGADGSQILTGSGAPGAGLGVNGDFYVNTANGDYYLKAAGAWALQGNLTGPQGDAGADGFGAFGPINALAINSILESGKVYGAVAAALTLTLPSSPSDGDTVGVACAVPGSYVSVVPASGMLNGNQASSAFGTVFGTLRFIYFTWSSSFGIWNIVDYGTITAWHTSGVYHNTQMVMGSNGIIYVSVAAAGQTGNDPTTDDGTNWLPFQLFSNAITYARLGSYFKTETDDGNSGLADTIDFSLTAAHKSTLTDNVEYTFTDPPGPAHVTLKIVQGSGPFAVTWPANVKWPGGTPPTLSATAGAIDVVSAYFDGTDYYCSIVQDF